MKVKELKEQLTCYDDDQEVFFAYPSGDYWRRTLASEVDNVDEAVLAWSEYHRCNKVVDPDDLDNYDKDELKEVIVLS